VADFIEVIAAITFLSLSCRGIVISFRVVEALVIKAEIALCCHLVTASDIKGFISETVLLLRSQTERTTRLHN
jgi:hypothetical protein